MGKRWVLIVCAVITFLLPAGCDPFHGRRPIDYPNTRWVAENPELFFEVGTDNNVTYAQIITDDEEIELLCNFGISGALIFFYPLSALMPPTEAHPYGIIRGADMLFSGLCKFGKSKLIVTINNNDKGFLDDSITEIVFIREDIE
jgi:hypothetical protein